jgi:invasion protein IalB
MLGRPATRTRTKEIATALDVKLARTTHVCSKQLRNVCFKQHRDQRGEEMHAVARIMIVCLALFGLTGGHGVAAIKIQKTFDGWQVECTEDDQGKKSCAVFIVFVQDKTKAIVLGWTIGRDSNSDLGRLVVRTLTGIDVSAGIAVQFGASKPVNIPYKTCMPQYCAAEVNFSENWLKAMNAAPKFTVIYKAANGKDVKQEIDLKGFAEAYKFYNSQIKA